MLHYLDSSTVLQMCETCRVTLVSRVVSAVSSALETSSTFGAALTIPEPVNSDLQSATYQEFNMQLQITDRPFHMLG